MLFIHSLVVIVDCLFVIVRIHLPKDSMLKMNTWGKLVYVSCDDWQVEDEFSRVEQRLESVTGFEELKLDEIEHLKFNFETGQESLTLQEVPLELANDAGIQGPYNSSVQFESGEVLFNMGHANRLTTVCVWCGVEFNHEGLNSEVQSDSVGYMCPSCKAKISGQLADLGSN